MPRVMMYEIGSPIVFIMNTVKNGVAMLIANTQAELNTRSLRKLDALRLFDVTTTVNPFYPAIILIT